MRVRAAGGVGVYESRNDQQVATTDATKTKVLSTLDSGIISNGFASNSVADTEWTLVGYRTGGVAAGSVGDSARFKRFASFKNVAGTVSMVGTVDTIGADTTLLGATRPWRQTARRGRRSPPLAPRA